MLTKVINQIRNSVVVIGLAQSNPVIGTQALLHLGTGFCLHHSNIFLTCRHVLRNIPQSGEGLHVMINPNNLGQCHIYKIIGWQPVGELDLAVFKVEESAKFEPLHLETEGTTPDGTEILLYGYPESITQWTAMFPNPETKTIPGLSNPAMFSRGSRGIISAQYSVNSQHLIEHDVETFPGLSGSPIIKVSNCKVVGLNEGHRPIGKRDEYQGPKFAINLPPYSSEIKEAVNSIFKA